VLLPSLRHYSIGGSCLYALRHPPFLCFCPQLNLKQAQAVKFLTTIEEATGYDDSLSTMYQLVQDSSLTDFFADKKTVATVFAPVDDVSCTAAILRTGICTHAKLACTNYEPCKLFMVLATLDSSNAAVCLQSGGWRMSHW
jgi:hypothetical protein